MAREKSYSCFGIRRQRGSGDCPTCEHDNGCRIASQQTRSCEKREKKYREQQSNIRYERAIENPKNILAVVR